MLKYTRGNTEQIKHRPVLRSTYGGGGEAGKGSRKT